VVALPPISERLVSALAQKFPDRAPDLQWTEKEVWFRSGQASVVRFLITAMQEQFEKGVDLEVG
jgi:hypothetical protein